MYKVVDSFSLRNVTVLALDKRPISGWNGKTVRIENVDYEAVMVYDIPNGIGIKGVGDFTGKVVELI